MRSAIGLFQTLLFLAFFSSWATASNAAGACPRPSPGSHAEQPENLYSSNGVLKVSFGYYTSMDDAGRTLFCFRTPGGKQGPTLHVKPGDLLDVTVTNHVPTPSGAPTEVVSNAGTQCGATTMTVASTNVHFHGTNTSPKCHSDEVIRTLINSGQTFHYHVRFPKDEPPGLYWYHQHVHGTSEAATQGGATGAIIVEGIGKYQPAILGLPQRILLIRDQMVVAKPKKGEPFPGFDVSLNYVPVNYPDYQLAIIQMKAGTREFWRVVNSAADTVMRLKVLYDDVAQPLDVVAFDGVPAGSQDGTHRGRIFTESEILIPPAGRAEFILTGPSAKVKNAVFQTSRVDTGPIGDVDPTRPLAVIRTGPDATTSPAEVETGTAEPMRFEGLWAAQPTAHRNLYFSETPPSNPKKFFVTVDGRNPLFLSQTILRPLRRRKAQSKTGPSKTGRARSTNSTYIRYISSFWT